MVTIDDIKNNETLWFTRCNALWTKNFAFGDRQEPVEVTVEIKPEENRNLVIIKPVNPSKSKKGFFGVTLEYYSDQFTTSGKVIDLYKTREDAKQVYNSVIWSELDRLESETQNFIEKQGKIKKRLEKFLED